MSYIDGYHDPKTEIIHVVERVNGKREYKEYPADYTFYFNDAKGKHLSMFGNRLAKFTCRNKKDFQREIRAHDENSTWEKDIKPLARCLEDNYRGLDSPKLNIAFFDIETDFDPKIGFSGPEEAANKITAISVYLGWADQLVALALPPKGMSRETAEEIAAKFDGKVFLFDSEAEMLEVFLDLIEDADMLSGWNSEGFDIPYIVNRIIRVLSRDDLRRLCLWGLKPKKRMFERFGKESVTFDLTGRVHLDYMQLYRKYTYHEMHSYALDAIGEYELDERKVAYEGTLDQLYNQDFEKFLEYSLQDTLLLYKLDKKLKFIDLANELAHENTVIIQATMGVVGVTDQGIINEAHSLGLIVQNRKRLGDDARTQAAGAYVAYPKKGMHKWIGSIDINSLYPSVIRALNMGPETVVGQLRQTETDAMIARKMAPIPGKRAAKGMSFAAAWEGHFGSLEYESVMAMEKDTMVTIDWENGDSSEHTGDEAYRLIFQTNQPWALSANGTIFNHEHKGIIPGLLERWYAERQAMQAKKSAATDPEEIAFWDKRQLVKKINLNSLYGALLNAGCRFFDQRIGQSTTLTGRTIAKHMDAFTNECITGAYDHVGDAIIYGDTDSVYFSAWDAVKDEIEAGKMEWDCDTATALYDTISDAVNESWPAFMEKAFHVPRDLGSIIKGGREITAKTGLFMSKKRYAALVLDDDGERKDVNGKPGKLKAMGLDLKRSDTPVRVQNFLSDILMDALTEQDKQAIIDKIIAFKTEFVNLNSWEKGTPKRVNNLTKYGAKLKKDAKANLPGHVRAALNWNKLRKMNSDAYSSEIMDGQKTIVCKLRDNPMGLKSVAYPIDDDNLPQWFKDLPFDDQLMEETIVDKKIENLFGVLKWNLGDYTQVRSTFNSLFAWD